MKYDFFFSHGKEGLQILFKLFCNYGTVYKKFLIFGKIVFVRSLKLNFLKYFYEFCKWAAEKGMLKEWLCLWTAQSELYRVIANCFIYVLFVCLCYCCLTLGFGNNHFLFMYLFIYVFLYFFLFSFFLSFFIYLSIYLFIYLYINIYKTKTQTL